MKTIELDLNEYALQAIALSTAVDILAEYTNSSKEKVMIELSAIAKQQLQYNPALVEEFYQAYLEKTNQDK